MSSIDWEWIERQCYSYAHKIGLINTHKRDILLGYKEAKMKGYSGHECYNVEMLYRPEYKQTSKHRYSKQNRVAHDDIPEFILDKIKNRQSI
jgi:hypothetical protein